MQEGTWHLVIFLNEDSTTKIANKDLKQKMD